MIPLVVLLSVFALGAIGQKLILRRYDLALSARLAMSAMLIFTGVGHFIYVEGMSMMIPSLVPWKKEIIYVTGVLEMVFAFLMMAPSMQEAAGWLVIIFLFMVLPANIYASIHHIDYQKASFEGPGPAYLWFRIPLQLFLIGWVYLSSVKSRRKGSMTGGDSPG